MKTNRDKFFKELLSSFKPDNAAGSYYSSKYRAWATVAGNQIVLTFVFHKEDMDTGKA